eukprot:TRINITY_DN13294_c0_g1_i1.p1 TRINITY_DN13294_c0_g1~~TRINITY_DN13294_c0_g1_i1.p1  ORF type:complete len:345 (-),score=47.72 TRINITY_DN13294_c0_g1_i1:1035-2069(-)
MAPFVSFVVSLYWPVSSTTLPMSSHGKGDLQLRRRHLGHQHLCAAANSISGSTQDPISESLRRKILYTVNIVAAMLFGVQTAAQLYIYFATFLPHDFELPLMSYIPEVQTPVILFPKSFEVVLDLMFGSGEFDRQQWTLIPLLNLNLFLAMLLGMACLAHTSVVLNKASFEFYMQKFIHRGCNAYRWTEYFFTSSGMVFLLARTCGITRVDVLFMLAGLQALVIFFGGQAESQKKKFWPTFTAWVIFFNMWLQLMLYGAPFWRTQWHHHTTASTLLPVMMGLFVLYGIVQILGLLRIGRWGEYMFVELSYIVLSLMTKTLMAFMLKVSTDYLVQAELKSMQDLG